MGPAMRQIVAEDRDGVALAPPHAWLACVRAEDGGAARQIVASVSPTYAAILACPSREEEVPCPSMRLTACCPMRRRCRAT